GLGDLVAGQGNIPGGGLDQAAVGNGAGAVGSYLVAPSGGRLVTGRALASFDDKAITAGQQGLAVGGGDAAGVVHILTQQQYITAAGGGVSRLGGGDLGTLLHD